MRLCLSCFLRHISTWKLTIMVILLLIALSVSHMSIFYAGRWYERSGLSQAWQDVANGMMNRDIAKQLAEKGKR